MKKLLLIPALLGIVFAGVAFDAPSAEAKTSILKIDLEYSYDGFGDYFFIDNISGESWGSVDSVDELNQDELTTCRQLIMVRTDKHGGQTINAHIKCKGHLADSVDHYRMVDGVLELLTMKGEGRII